jgi:hypothetical protein
MKSNSFNIAYLKIVDLLHRECSVEGNVVDEFLTENSDDTGQVVTA